MRIPAAVRGSGGLKLAVAVALAVLASALPWPRGSVSAASSTLCVGTMSVTFSPAITPTPNIASNTITLSGGGTCIGQASGSGSWGGTGAALPGTSCTGPVVATAVAGSITMPVPIGNITGNFAGGGTTALQTWVFTSSVTGAAVGVGVFAVNPATQIASCITSGSATTITMTGVLVAYG
jgi:hypothetical protein